MATLIDKTAATLDSVNPATGDPWAVMPAASEVDVDRAVAAAKRALHDGPWSAMSATQRGKLLRRLGDLIGEQAERLGDVETIDSGKRAGETRSQPR